MVIWGVRARFDGEINCFLHKWEFVSGFSGCFFLFYKWLRPCRRPLEFICNFGSNLGAGEAGGLRPPAPPCFPGGSTPQNPPKGAPRPWLQRLVAFSRPTGAAALPGAELFLRSPTFF